MSGVARSDPPQTLIQSIKVKLINFTDMDLTEVARGEPASTQIKATEVKLKSNEAISELDFNFTEMFLFLLLRVQLQCNVDELGGDFIATKEFQTLLKNFNATKEIGTLLNGLERY